MKKVLFPIAMLAGALCLLESCDPDEVDAFADGYRQGYYGSYCKSYELDSLGMEDNKLYSLDSTIVIEK